MCPQQNNRTPQAAAAERQQPEGAEAAARQQPEAAAAEMRELRLPVHPGNNREAARAVETSRPAENWSRAQQDYYTQLHQRVGSWQGEGQLPAEFREHLLRNPDATGELLHGLHAELARPSDRAACAQHWRMYTAIVGALANDNASQQHGGRYVGQQMLENTLQPQREVSLDWRAVEQQERDRASQMTAPLDLRATPLSGSAADNGSQPEHDNSFPPGHAGRPPVRERSPQPEFPEGHAGLPPRRGS